MACDFPSTEALAAVESTSLVREIELLETAVVKARENVDILVRLGELYSRSGRIREGLAVDLRLVTLAPRDPIVLYNLACSLSLWHKPEPALRMLELALEYGYDDEDHLVQDPDLAAVGELGAFDDFLSRLRLRASIRTLHRERP